MPEPIGPAPALHGDGPAAFSPQGLVDRRELAFIAVERTRMPMVVTDPRQPDNPIVLANRAYLELTGYTAEELIGRNSRFMQGRDTDDDSVAMIRDAIKAEEEIVIELINYRKDGSAFWNQLFISPVHDDNGQLLYFFGSLLDVTRRRAAQSLEVAERRLLKEVDHRAKNALALVQGIVRLTRADDPARYARLVEGRVDVLARAHGLLAERGWRDVSLGRLISTEAATMRSARIRTEGPNVAVPAGKVQPLALLLHELLMNAEQHGSLSGEGELLVSWTPTAGHDAVTIDWNESGGPAPAADCKPGFGLTLGRSIAERQLGGAAQIDFAHGGMQATITLPLNR